MSMMERVTACYHDATARLDTWLGAATLVGMRLWVALAFWQAGLVKVASPETTRYLFENMYHVPLLSPDLAALLGTWIELVVPWFIGLGLLSRPFALFLFIYNIIAFVSYPALWPHGFWMGLFSTSAFADHKVWGLMLLAVMTWGPGKISLDTLVGWVCGRWHGIASQTNMGA